MNESARVWSLIRTEIMAIGERWLHRALTERDMRAISAEATSAMRRVAHAEHHDLTGWAIELWNPHTFMITRTITLIATHGDNGYSIDALAMGGYGPDPLRYVGEAVDGEALAPIDPEAN